MIPPNFAAPDSKAYCRSVGRNYNKHTGFIGSIYGGEDKVSMAAPAECGHPQRRNARRL
jgi:hypothetical protein